MLWRFDALGRFKGICLLAFVLGDERGLALSGDGVPAKRPLDLVLLIVLFPFPFHKPMNVIAWLGLGLLPLVRVLCVDFQLRCVVLVLTTAAICTYQVCTHV